MNAQQATAAETEGSSGVLEGWLTRDELAAELGIKPDTLQRWHKARTGPPCTLIGRTYYYRRAAVREWLEAREIGMKGARR
ncbi:MAG: hypothetical protein Kow0032_07610 [Methyloligellaceae bacterium]